MDRMDFAGLRSRVFYEGKGGAIRSLVEFTEVSLGIVPVVGMTAIALPFILVGKAVDSLDMYLWRKGLMDWNPEYPQRKEKNG